MRNRSDWPVNVACWPEGKVRQCQLFRRCRVLSGHNRIAVNEYAPRRPKRGKLGDGELVAVAALLCAAGGDVACVEPKKPRSRGDAEFFQCCLRWSAKG